MSGNQYMEFPPFLRRLSRVPLLKLAEKNLMMGRQITRRCGMHVRAS